MLILFSGFLPSCMSGFIPNEVYISHYFWSTDGQDCTLNPCLNAASGWPIAFIWDKSWNSPVGSADWLGVWHTTDHFNLRAFIKNTFIWYIPVLVLVTLRRWTKVSSG